MSQTNLVENPLPTELGSVIFCVIDGKPDIAIAWSQSRFPDWRMSNGNFYTHAEFSKVVESWTLLTAKKVSKWRGAHRRIKALREIMRQPFPKNDFYINGMANQYDALEEFYGKDLADQLSMQIEP